eukprot:4604394-Pleurochrysis_carterae.AAC.4
MLAVVRVLSCLTLSALGQRGFETDASAVVVDTWDDCGSLLEMASCGPFHTREARREWLARTAYGECMGPSAYCSAPRLLLYFLLAF